jgi:hypothetical protein
MTIRTTMRRLPIILATGLLALILSGCGSVEASLDAGSGFGKSATLAVLDGTETGKALEAELFARGFNVIAGTKDGAAARAEPRFIARLIVRRTWRGVVSGTVPGTVSVAISDAATGKVVATASYSIGSMSYNNAHDAAKELVDALEKRLPR